VFLYGLDQRYVDIQINGFNVVDSSTPLGVLNLSQLSGVKGLEIERFKTDQIINLNTHNKKQKSRFNISGTQFGEYGTSLKINKKRWQLNAGLNRAGGFSQTFIGDEKDWTDDRYLTLDYETQIFDLKSSSHIFYTGQNQDYDSVFNNTENAESETSFLLAGQKVKFNDYEIRLSYTLSDREFIEDSSVNSFKGENFQSNFLYKKWFSLIVSSESNNDLSDQSIKLDLKPFKTVKTSFLWTKLREQFFSFEWAPYEEISFFYKELPASLFQINFDPSIELDPQKSFGLKLFRDFKFYGIDYRIDALYQKAFDQIEFVTPQMAYQNFERSEVIFGSITASYSKLSFYLQGQRAKNLAQNEDLPRRPKWILGLDYEDKIGLIHYDLGLRWNSSFKAFDQSNLSSFWTSQINAKYKSFRFVVMNVLNQDRPIFRDFRRRPVTFELHYSYDF
jgi:hypothetical protein